MRKTVILAAATLGLAGLAAPALAQNVIREGAGTRRQQLDDMELKPFPYDIAVHLTQWTGEPVEVGAGEPALIVTFATWYAPSMTGLSVAQRMADSYGDQGLKVIAVHDPRGFDDAPKTLEQRKITIPVALDAEGKFREALKVDQDPDFYVVDRAGRLRYADIDTRSVPAAVKEVVSESRDVAADLPERLAAERAATERDRRRTGVINPEANLADLPDFDPRPGAEMYAAADWPDRWTEFEEKELSRRGRGETEAPTLALPADIEQFGKPLRTSGRATVVYLWFPDVVRSYQRVQPQMDLLAREKTRDVAVVGLLAPTPSENRRRSDDDEAAEAIRAQRFEQQVRRARTERRYDHTIVVDRGGAILQQILGGDGRGSRGQPYTPLAAIFSSDGRLRWIGSPDSSQFNSALEHLLRADPGVQMRRTLEESFIRERGG
jgi:hypothetical protein